MDQKSIEWECIEIIERKDKIFVQSRYDSQEEGIIIGVLEYLGGGVRETEVFDGFDKYATWELEGLMFGVGRIQEENRCTYAIEFFDESYRYYIIGTEQVLDTIKKLVVDYRKVIESK